MPRARRSAPYIAAVNKTQLLPYEQPGPLGVVDAAIATFLGRFLQGFSRIGSLLGIPHHTSRIVSG